MLINNLKNFSAQNFEEIFDHIVESKVNNSDIKKFLLDLNSADIPTNSIIGAIRSLKKRMKTISAPVGTIDVCGTGGDGLNTLNISTAVAFVVAACGVPVAKHGNKAISSKSGSADIFSALGINFSSDISEAEATLRDKNICFLYAPFFHESLKNLAEIRKSLNVPTIFNFLGPLLNPANVKLQLIGVAKHAMLKKIATAISATSEDSKAYVVCGMDGMDEISICDNSYFLTVENGKISAEEIINPAKYGFAKAKIESLTGQNPEYNAKKLLALFNGEKSAYRDIVILNSAFALKLAEKVKTVAEGVMLASSAIDDGKALGVLKSLSIS